jgi:hypothetical protein
MKRFYMTRFSLHRLTFLAVMSVALLGSSVEAITAPHRVAALDVGSVMSLVARN